MSVYIIVEAGNSFDIGNLTSIVRNHRSRDQYFNAFLAALQLTRCIDIADAVGSGTAAITRVGYTRFPLFLLATFALPPISPTHEWDGALDWAEAAIAVAEAEEDVAPVKLIPLTHPRAGDWELVVLEEHVVEVDHLCEHHTLVLWSPGGAGLRELEVVGISWSAARNAPLTAGDRTLLGDGADIVGTRGSGDVELSIAEEVLATTEAHWALSDTNHGLVT